MKRQRLDGVDGCHGARDDIGALDEAPPPPGLAEIPAWLLAPFLTPSELRIVGFGLQRAPAFQGYREQPCYRQYYRVVYHTSHDSYHEMGTWQLLHIPRLLTVALEGKCSSSLDDVISIQFFPIWVNRSQPMDNPVPHSVPVMFGSNGLCIRTVFNMLMTSDEVKYAQLHRTALPPLPLDPSAVFYRVVNYNKAREEHMEMGIWQLGHVPHLIDQILAGEIAVWAGLPNSSEYNCWLSFHETPLDETIEVAANRLTGGNESVFEDSIMFNITYSEGVDPYECDSKITDEFGCSITKPALFHISCDGAIRNGSDAHKALVVARHDMVQ